MIFVLSANKPNTYITQPFFRFCGACQLSQIVLHKKGKVIHYRAIFSWLIWWLGFCSPDKLYKMCNNLWLNASLGSAWSLEKIRNNLRQWKVIILLIAHAYDQTGSWFNVIKAPFFQHYISLWWFDDDGFFVYDSSIKVDNPCLPIWNTYIKNELLQRCWDWWWLWLYTHLFISID